MQCPDAASTPCAAASATQNVPASASSLSRRVMSVPPMTITAYAATSQTVSGPHQKSSGSILELPSTMNATTSPRFDGLNTCEPRYLITYFVASEKAATPANTHQPSVVHGWSAGVPTT